MQHSQLRQNAFPLAMRAYKTVAWRSVSALPEFLSNDVVAAIAAFQFI
jgi:hypothetical protein